LAVWPSGITLDEHLGQPVKEQLDLFIDLSPEGELDVTAGIHKYGYRANWKFQVENSMDGYHPNFVHQTFFTNLQHRTGMKLTDLFTSSSSSLTRDLGNGHVMLDYRPYNRENSRRMQALLPSRPGERNTASNDRPPWRRTDARDSHRWRRHASARVPQSRHYRRPSACDSPGDCSHRGVSLPDFTKRGAG
jgi:phenylpropionate dioxygenase-like ring-hydroxylating dioxygenase large terminal subunit